MIDERIRIEYWPTSPSATVSDRQHEVAGEVEEPVDRARVDGPERQHPRRREPAESRGEDHEQQHADDEVRHRIQDQAGPVADEVDRAAASPAGVGAQGEPDDDGDDLAEPEQDDRRPEVRGDHVDDGRPVELERVAEVTRGRRRDVPDELVREERLVETPPRAGLGQRLLRDVRIARQCPFG